MLLVLFSSSEPGNNKKIDQNLCLSSENWDSCMRSVVNFSNKSTNDKRFVFNWPKYCCLWFSLIDFDLIVMFCFFAVFSRNWFSQEFSEIGSFYSNKWLCRRWIFHQTINKMIIQMCFQHRKNCTQQALELRLCGFKIKINEKYTSLHRYFTHRSKYVRRWLTNNIL